MKKVLFIINSLAVGGSEKSLVSLLNLIDYSKYEVDLLMFKKGEDFDKYIPKQVNILEEPEYYQFLAKRKLSIPISSKIKYFFYRLKTSLNIRINRVKNKQIHTEQVLYKSQKNILYGSRIEYDVAIAYSQGMPTYFLVDKITAKKKIAWINCDYTTTNYHKKIDYLFYSKIDKIVVVSNTIRESIIKLIPEYSGKIETILDIIEPNLIKKMATEEEHIFEDKSCTNILTVARLVINYKGYDIAIKAAKLLRDNNYKFKWFVIGEGQDRKQMELLIKRYNLEEHFILLGKKVNPYPYMKNCDIYVQPSRMEGFGLTVIEAKILKKPILCTNFNTSKELINNEQDGLIVGQNEKEIYLGIKKYLDEYEFIEKILKKLENTETYNSVSEIQKFYKLIS